MAPKMVLLPESISGPRAARESFLSYPPSPLVIIGSTRIGLHLQDAQGKLTECGGRGARFGARAHP
jgi:hypothetical protein